MNEEPDPIKLDKVSWPPEDKYLEQDETQGPKLYKYRNYLIACAFEAASEGLFSPETSSTLRDVPAIARLLEKLKKFLVQSGMPNSEAKRRMLDYDEILTEYVRENFDHIVAAVERLDDEAPQSEMITEEVNPLQNAIARNGVPKFSLN